MMEFFKSVLDWINENFTVVISAVAVLITFWFNRHSRKLANDRLLKELFTEFNQRYDRLNNNLDTVSKMSFEEWEELSKEKKKIYYAAIIDYFNICAEEFYWHSQGRINSNIWTSWEKGMNDIYNRSDLIKSLWEEECLNEGYKSYYIEKPDAFFKAQP